MSFKKQQPFMKQQTFYAVGVGRQRGIYLTWPECEKQVKGINNAKYRKFNSRVEAEKFVEDHASPIAKNYSPYKPNTPPVTPTQPSFSQPAKTPSTTSNAMSKSRQLMSTWSSQPQVETRSSEAASTSKKIKIEESNNSSDDECLHLMDALTQEAIGQSSTQLPTTTTTTNGKETEEQGLKNQLDALKNRLESIEESIHDVFGQATIGIKNIKQELSKLESKIEEKEPSLTNTVKRLKEKNNTRESNNPTKKARLIESDDSGAGSSQETGSSQINFNFDVDGFCVVYTDGSCTNNGRNGAKAGIGVYFGPNHPLNVGDPLRNCTPTNNNAEIQAASYAINVAKVSGIAKLCVHTDSEFLINCVTKWMNGWKRRGWRKADNKPVINKEQLEILDAAMENIEIKWVHVRGHSNIYGNEMADQLANEGAAKYGDD